MRTNYVISVSFIPHDLGQLTFLSEYTLKMASSFKMEMTKGLLSVRLKIGVCKVSVTLYVTVVALSLCLSFFCIIISYCSISSVYYSVYEVKVYNIPQFYLGLHLLHPRTPCFYIRQNEEMRHREKERENSAHRVSNLLENRDISSLLHITLPHIKPFQQRRWLSYSYRW